MMKSLWFVLLIFISMASSQDYKTNICFGYTPMAGFEFGFLGEGNISNLNLLKITSRGTIGYKFLLDNDLYSGTIYGSFQAGVKLKLLKNKLNPSLGFSFNPFMPFRKDNGQMESLFVGFGPFVGISTAIGNAEPALILTYDFSNGNNNSTLLLFTFLISKSF
jgi:hypothetical protein